MAREGVTRTRWLGVDEAARILGVPVLTLRRALERSARRDRHGCVHAEVVGVRARRFGRRWRVWLDWLEPDRARRTGS
jgi:hypothetical protein